MTTGVDPGSWCQWEPWGVSFLSQIIAVDVGGSPFAAFIGLSLYIRDIPCRTHEVRARKEKNTDAP